MMNKPIKATQYLHWHAWQGVAGPILSDERVKQLFQFKTADDLINHLWLTGNKETARAFNKAFKQCT